MLKKRPRVNVVDSVFNDAPPPDSGDEVKQKRKLSYYDEWLESSTIRYILGIPLEDLRFFPKKYAIMFGTLAYTVVSITFLYFLVSGYVAQRKLEFISLKGTVKKPVDAAYHVSDRGFWQNDGDFSYSEAKYQAEFVALEVTQAEFNTLMEDFQSDIDVMGTAAIELPFVYNLLTVMHMGLFKSAPGSTDVSQFFAFTALPSSVYNRKNAAASIGSSVGICSLTPRASFAPVNSFFTVTWGFTQFNSTCGNVANPMAALEYTARDGESLEVSFDLITLSSAVAANYGILTALDLETVSKMYFPVYKKLQLLRKYDPFFTGMTTMYCLSLSTSDEFVNVTTSFEHTYNLITTRILEGEEGACFYVISDTLAVPTVNHNTLACSSCNASRSNAVCNDFDILIGLVYFPHSNNEPVNGLKGVFDALELYYSFNSQLNFSDSAYDAVHGIGTGGSFVSSWFDFCGDACVVLAANVWDNDHSITPYFYQYENAHCQDGLSSTSFSALGMNPPMVLVEVYWKCVSSAWDAFIQSVGIASGNTNTFSPWLIFFIIGPAITLYFNSINGDPPEAKYDALLLEKAQREFIEKVLQANDGTLDGLPHDSIIRGVGRELYTLANFEEQVYREDKNTSGKIYPVGRPLEEKEQLASC